jgi:hypothetical protein
MGVLLKWRSIDSEATYDKARVWRSATRDSGYALVATQDIADQSYYDQSGTTSSWYKIDFYQTSNSAASSLSDPIQGGTFKGYCTVEDVRNMTNLTTNDLTDTQLCLLIEYCGAQLNEDMNVYLEEEEVWEINNTKTNKIDGTNATYYTKKYPIGDSNNDMAVDTTDLEVYQYLSDGTKQQLTVSSITPNTGKFILSIAPASSIVKITVTYRYCQLSVSDPNALVKMACALLTAAWAYTKINVGKAPRWRMGSTQIWRDMDSFKTYYNKYLQILTQINDRSNLGIVDGVGMPGGMGY